MAIEKFVLGKNDHVVLVSDLDPETCKARLREQINENGSMLGPKPLGGYCDDQSFELSPSSPLLAIPFQPLVRGRITSQDGRTVVAATVEMRPFIRGLVAWAMRLAVGALLVFIATLFMFPALPPLIYSFAATFLIPSAVAVACLVALRLTYPAALGLAVDSVRSTLAAVDLTESQASREIARPPVAEHLWRDLAAVVTGMLLTLGTAFFMHSAAWNLWTEGRYSECAELCKPVLALVEGTLGSGNARSGDCRYYLAECLRCQGKYREAEDLYRQSLALLEGTLGSQHHFIADLNYNLARTLEAQGELAEAEPLYKRSIELWNAAWGKGNPVSTKAENRLAMLYDRMGRYQEAARLQEGVLAADEKFFGKNSQAWGQDTNDLSVIYFHMGDRQGAQKFIEVSITAKSSLPLSRRYSLATSLFNRAKINALAPAQDEKRALEIWSEYAGRGQEGDREGLYRAVLVKSQPDYEVPHSEARVDAALAPPTRP